jgi:hypothetical protein
VALLNLGKDPTTTGADLVVKTDSLDESVVLEVLTDRLLPVPPVPLRLLGRAVVVVVAAEEEDYTNTIIIIIIKII